MGRSERPLRLVQLLRRDRVVTAARLAVELGVSKRTIYRDIRDLTASGIPVEGEAGVGYRLARGFDLPPITFTSDEVEALVLGTRMVEAWGDPDLAQAARAALDKVVVALPPTLRGVLERTALFAPNGWPDAPEALGPLRQAITRAHRVRFSYVRRDGEASERTVRPVALYFWGRTWSLAAWCELREDWRNFRPDRIADLELVGPPDDPDDGIDLDGFLRFMQRRNQTSG